MGQILCSSRRPSRKRKSHVIEPAVANCSEEESTNKRQCVTEFGPKTKEDSESRDFQIQLHSREIMYMVHQDTTPSGHDHQKSLLLIEEKLMDRNLDLTWSRCTSGNNQSLQPTLLFLIINCVLCSLRNAPVISRGTTRCPRNNPDALCQRVCKELAACIHQQQPSDTDKLYYRCNGQTIMHVAFQLLQMKSQYANDVVSALVKYSANSQPLDSDGHTPIVSLLLAHKNQVKNSGKIDLDTIKDCIQLMQTLNMDLNVRCSDGSTFLHVICGPGFRPLMLFHLMRTDPVGLDWNIRNHKNKTCLDKIPGQNDEVTQLCSLWKARRRNVASQELDTQTPLPDELNDVILNYVDGTGERLDAKELLAKYNRDLEYMMSRPLEEHEQLTEDDLVIPPSDQEESDSEEVEFPAVIGQ